MRKKINPMKIAVCGSGQILDKKVAEKAKAIGKEIALLGHTLITGACHGYPNEAAKEAFADKGKVIGYSPAKNKKEHIEKYKFPAENFSEIIFTGKGIPDRNLDIIRKSDAVIFIGGKVGTLNEFTIAMHERKKIGVLLETGGISGMLRDIAEIINKNGEKENIVYEKDEKKLIRNIL